MTPLMQQYQDLRRQLSADTLLLFRIGDFYEAFFDDAKAIAALLNVTLTKRNGVPMCGLPYYSLDHSVQALRILGRGVAICDQVGEPKPGALVQRKIVEIFSPEESK